MNIKELVDNFSLFEDWEDRYRYLISLGASLPPMEEDLKTESSLVKGCMSQVWMVLGWDEHGRIILLADSDAQIVKGLIAVLSVLFAGKTKAEAEKTHVTVEFAALGLDQHLSPNRRNGFFAMVERVSAFIAGS
jgi:cysteine desulfuration protein SufE